MAWQLLFGMLAASAIADAITVEGNRRETRLIVLTGAGDSFFAAGGDLVELAGVRDEAAVIAMTDAARVALDTVRHCAVPVLAYLNGDAIGGGAELALACDMRMQASHARIGFIQAKLAITSAWGGGPDLCQLVGAARAMRMMSRCELVDAEQALRWGLADAVISDGPAGADLQAFITPRWIQVLLLLPDSGDMVQAMKAGIMEMADIFVVNKADLPGARKMATDVKRIASINRQERGAWVPAVLLASASQPASIEALSAEIDRHQAWLETSERRAALLQQRARYRLRRLVEVRTTEVLARQDSGFFERPLAQQMASVLDLLGQAIPR